MSAARLVVRMPFRDSTLSPFLVGSIAIHVAFAVFIIFSPGFGGSSTLPEDIVIVDVVAAIPAGPPPAPAPVVETAPPPESEPQVEPEGVKIEPEDVTPPKKDPPKPKPEKKPDKKPEVKTPTPVPPKPATEIPPGGDPAAGTGPGGGAETTGSGVVGVDLGALGHAWYRDSVAAMLRRNWVRPVLEAREALEVTVAFEILRDGTVRNVRIGEASGVQSLDRSALRAVVDASPLPPLPSSWREPAVSAQFLFRWLPGEN